MVALRLASSLETSPQVCQTKSERKVKNIFWGILRWFVMESIRKSQILTVGLASVILR